MIGIGAGLLLTFPFLACTKNAFAKALLAAGIALATAAIYQSLAFSYENRVTAVFFRIGTIPAVLLLLACLFAAAAFLLLRGGERISWDSRRAKKILAAAITAAVAAGIAVVWACPFTKGALSEAHLLLHGNVSPEFGSSRIKIWQESLKLIPGHLWFGGGPDTLAERMTFHFTRYNETLGMTVESHIDTAHNDYLNILVNTGLFSVLFYLGALISAAFRSARKSEGDRTAPVLMTALLCYLVQIFFSFSLCIVSPFFWAYLGLLEAALLENKERRCSNKCVPIKKS